MFVQNIDLFVIPIMIEADSFLFIYYPGFDFARISKRDSLWLGCIKFKEDNISIFHNVIPALLPVLSSSLRQQLLNLLL